MYKEIVCWNTGNSYLVTDTENIPTSVRFFTRDEDGYYNPSDYKKEYYVRKTAVKPSVYKRDWFQCYKDEYKYAFTEKVTRTTTREKDVYFNAERGKFVTKTRSNKHNVRVEYDFPYQFVF